MVSRWIDVHVVPAPDVGATPRGWLDREAPVVFTVAATKGGSP
jgi:hypothetical protein